MRSKRDARAMWADALADEPPVDESLLITSSMINRQTAARLSREELVADEMTLRFAGISTANHRLAVRSASKALLALQESLTSVGASIADHIGRAGRWPAEVLNATQLEFTPRVMPGSVEFTLVHDEVSELTLFSDQDPPLFNQSLNALFKFLEDLADDSLAQKTVVDQLVGFGPRTSKHLFDLAQVLLTDDLSIDAEWRTSDGRRNTAAVGRRSAAYLKELAAESATSTFERTILGYLITVSEVDKQGIQLDDGSKILLEASSELQDQLASLYRERVRAIVEETLTVSLSTGAESRTYTLINLRAYSSEPPEEKK